MFKRNTHYLPYMYSFTEFVKQLNPFEGARESHHFFEIMCIRRTPTIFTDRLGTGCLLKTQYYDKNRIFKEWGT